MYLEEFAITVHFDFIFSRGLTTTTTETWAISSDYLFAVFRRDYSTVHCRLASERRAPRQLAAQNFPDFRRLESCSIERCYAKKRDDGHGKREKRDRLSRES